MLGDCCLSNRPGHRTAFIILIIAAKSHGMTDPRDDSPRRYFVDNNERRVLIGLTIEETLEFERLDSLPAFDESGNHVAWGANGMPPTTREKRWLELYSKHDTAWRQWMVETYADRFARFNIS
jgi:hypothetical protein